MGDLYCNKDCGFYNPDLGKQYHLQSLNNFLSDFLKNPDVDTALKIGTFYHYGKGVDRNPDEAEKWYKKALEVGNEYAQEQLNKLHQKNENELTPQS